MAKDKKSFLMYADYYELFTELTDEEAGQLIKHIFKYVNDESPEPENKTVKLSFIPIKQQLKRDLQKWDTIREKRSLAGKKSAESRQQKATNQTHVECVKQEPTKSTVSVNDNDNVNDNVNVIVNDNVTVKGNVINKDSLFDFLELMNNDIWLEAIAMQNELTPAKLEDLKTQFINDRKLDENYKDLDDIKTWFVNYVKRNKGTPIKNEDPSERTKRIVKLAEQYQKEKYESRN